MAMVLSTVGAYANDSEPGSTQEMMHRGAPDVLALSRRYGVTFGALGGTWGTSEVSLDGSYNEAWH